MSTACVIVIGNEILSGRTQDTNTSWLAKNLNELGIKLREVRIIPDVPEAIIHTVNECRAKYDYVFTTGGIGPTHDDITSECIARAFGVPYILHPQAEVLLLAHYGAKINEARLKMAAMPKGAALIPNPESIAPGFIIGNVYVMAGVPSIMQVMFEGIKHTLKGGRVVLSETVTASVPEGTLAKDLSTLQDEFPDVEIGSYPFKRGNLLGTDLVARSEDAARLAEVKAKLEKLVNNTQAKP